MSSMGGGGAVSKPQGERRKRVENVTGHDASMMGHTMGVP